MTDPTRISQTRAILAYMQQGYSITPELARTMFGCARLASRIWELKLPPFQADIADDWVKTYGGARVKKYFLKPV